jgi:3-hydroxyacyl-[acyl-carrier-protein] dehydratase
MTSVDRPLRIRPLKPIAVVNGKSLPLLAEDLQEILPHRGALALVDRIDEIDAGTRAVGRHLVPRNEPLLEGHFPGRPIVPGVVLIEALAQLAGVVLWSGQELEPGDGPPMLGVLAGVKKFRFHRLVVPGDGVRLEATRTGGIGGLSEFRATAHVERELAAEGVVQLALRP